MNHRRAARLATTTALLLALTIAGCDKPDPSPAASSPVFANVDLVSTSGPMFPYTLPGLGNPLDFTSTGDVVFANWGSHGGSAYLNLGTLVTEDDRKMALMGAQAVDLGGRTAWAMHQGAQASLLWQLSSGRWVMLNGEHKYGTVQALETLAGQVVEKPQSMRYAWTIGRIPRGWTLKDDEVSREHYTYADPADPSTDVLTVAGSDHIVADLSQYVTGYVRTLTVNLNGRPMPIAQATSSWLMQGQLPNGKVFEVRAPISFSPETVAALVASISPGAN